MKSLFFWMIPEVTFFFSAYMCCCAFPLLYLFSCKVGAIVSTVQKRKDSQPPPCTCLTRLGHRGAEWGGPGLAREPGTLQGPLMPRYTSVEFQPFKGVLSMETHFPSKTAILGIWVSNPSLLLFPPDTAVVFFYHPT